MKIYPTIGKVAISIDEQKEKTTSAGIIHSSIDNHAPLTGTIESIGPIPPNSKGKIIPLEYKIGDRVMIPRRVYNSIHGYAIFEQHEPFAIIDKDAVIGGLG